MRVLLTVVAAVLYALGWVAGKVWVVLAWLGTAVLVGWRDATRPKPAGYPAGDKTVDRMRPPPTDWIGRAA